MHRSHMRRYITSPNRRDCYAERCAEKQKLGGDSALRAIATVAPAVKSS